jgi:hypothetical protein
MRVICVTNERELLSFGALVESSVGGLFISNGIPDFDALPEEIEMLSVGHRLKDPLRDDPSRACLHAARRKTSPSPLDAFASLRWRPRPPRRA